MSTDCSPLARSGVGEEYDIDIATGATVHGFRVLGPGDGGCNRIASVDDLTNFDYQDSIGSYVLHGTIVVAGQDGIKAGRVGAEVPPYHGASPFKGAGAVSVDGFLMGGDSNTDALSLVGFRRDHSMEHSPQRRHLGSTGARTSAHEERIRSGGDRR